MYGLFPSQTTAFPFYSANAAQLQNSVAYGQSFSNEATTTHNNYFNDNHKQSVYGKKCSNYVCAHSADSFATRIGILVNRFAIKLANSTIGSNYNLERDHAHVNEAATNENLAYGSLQKEYLG